MEEREYSTAAQAETTVVCSHCKQVIGEYEERDGRIWLRMPGGLLLYSLSGVHDCGQVFHWSISEKRLEHLIRRVQARHRET